MRPNIIYNNEQIANFWIYTIKHKSKQTKLQNKTNQALHNLQLSSQKSHEQWQFPGFDLKPKTKLTKLNGIFWQLINTWYIHGQNIFLNIIIFYSTVSLNLDLVIKLKNIFQMLFMLISAFNYEGDMIPSVKVEIKTKRLYSISVSLY